MIFEQYIGEAIVAIISVTTGWFVGLKKQKADTKKIEIEILEKSLEVVQTKVIEPLSERLAIAEESIKKISNERNKLYEAIEKMYKCRLFSTCPIRVELQKSNLYTTNRQGANSQRPTNRQREPVDETDDESGNDSTDDSEAQYNT